MYNPPSKIFLNDLTWGPDRYKSPKKKSSFLSWCWWEPKNENLTSIFCMDSSLHGLKYIGQPKRHFIERVFWCLSFLCGLIIAIILIRSVWKKYQENPVIISFQPYETSIHKIPFPAITICNVNKVLKSKAEEYIYKTDNLDINTTEFSSALGKVYLLDHVCSTTSSFSQKTNISQNSIFKELYERYNISNIQGDKSEVQDFLQQSSQKCASMISYCIWQDKLINCSEIFRPIETDFGKCCTFNFMPLTLLDKFRNDTREDSDEIEEWAKWEIKNAQSGGIVLENHPGEFPRRQTKSGKPFGLSILLDPDISEYYCTASDSIGFILQPHLPFDIPHVNDYGIPITKSTETFVELLPELTIASSSIRSFSYKKRKCYFLGEFELEFYNYYTQNNCIDECLAKLTLKKCNCLRFFMPRNENSTLCGPKQYNCAHKVKRNFIKIGSTELCGHCRPTCSSLNYLTHTTIAELQGKYRNRELGKWDLKKFNFNMSIVHLYFGLDSIYARYRTELFGTTDLLSNTGGLMGLCLGFSGLSLVEIIYFLTIRAFYGRRNRIQKLANENNSKKSSSTSSRNLRRFGNRMSFKKFKKIFEADQGRQMNENTIRKRNYTAWEIANKSRYPKNKNNFDDENNLNEKREENNSFGSFGEMNPYYNKY